MLGAGGWGLGAKILLSVSPRFSAVQGQLATSNQQLFEQVVKGLPRAACARRAAAAAGGRTGLTLDGCARLEQRACVAHILRRDSRRQLRILCALPTGTGVERHALHTAVKIDAAARAPRIGSNRELEQVAAARTAANLVRRHEVRRLRTRCILEDAAGRAFLRRARCGRPLRTAGLRLVLVSALPVFAVAHRYRDYTKALAR
jgi:hypothetical protein